ncbi:MAG TPA: glycosyltransferase family 39 protein [Blastocatellia bacterium]|nr:glycosyltransferase family 39 protein [Blastocatellia bacterium]
MISGLKEPATKSTSAAAARPLELRKSDSIVSARYILVGFFIIYSCSTLVWSHRNQMPPPWDPSDHFITAYEYLSLARTSFAAFISDFFFGLHYYPPVFHLAVASFFWIFGVGSIQSILVNIVALAVLIFSTFKIGSHLFTERAGCLAAILVASYHLPASLLHEGFIDYLMLAEVSLSMWLLLRAGDFKRRSDALILALSLALGMLTKETFALFLVFPIVAVSAKVLINRDRQAIANLFLCGVVALGVLAIWYAPHFSDVREIFDVNQQGAIREGEPPAFSLPSFTAYAFILAREQIQLPLTILFIAGLIYTLIYKRRESAMLYIWFGGGYLICTLLANKDPRYTLSYLPAIALLSVALIEVKSTVWKWALITIVAAVSLFSFVNAQWPMPGRGFHREGFSATLGLNYSINIFDRNLLNYDHYPIAADWSLGKITKLIADNSKGQQEIHIGMGINIEYFNPSNLGWFVRMQDAREHMPKSLVISIFDEGDRDLMVPSCGFLVTSSKRDGASFPLVDGLYDEVTIAGRYSYTNIGLFVLPDGMVVGVYKQH